MVKYIDEQEFKDFKTNFSMLIKTFNHSVTSLKKDVSKIRKDNEEQQTILDKVREDVAVIKTTLTNSNKIIWWIMGIVSSIVVAAIIGSIIK